MSHATTYTQSCTYTRTHTHTHTPHTHTHTHTHTHHTHTHTHHTHTHTHHTHTHTHTHTHHTHTHTHTHTPHTRTHTHTHTLDLTWKEGYPDGWCLVCHKVADKAAAQSLCHWGDPIPNCGLPANTHTHTHTPYITGNYFSNVNGETEHCTSANSHKAIKYSNPHTLV